MATDEEVAAPDSSEVEIEALVVGLGSDLERGLSSGAAAQRRPDDRWGEPQSPARPEHRPVDGQWRFGRDFRDWDQIRAWADDIADRLIAPRTPAGPPKAGTQP